MERTGTSRSCPSDLLAIAPQMITYALPGVTHPRKAPLRRETHVGQVVAGVLR
jgi:hypothetical protein